MNRIDDKRTNCSVKGEMSAEKLQYEFPLNNLSMIIDIVSQSCNLRCGYCHEDAGTSSSELDVDAHVENAGWLLNKTRKRNIKWVFHGGEPLLCERSKLEDLIKNVRKIARKSDIRIKFGMQTNGTLIDNEWIRWLSKYDIRVCVSCDGPPEINNLYRERGQDVEKSLHLLMSSGLNPSVLCLMTNGNAFKIQDLIYYFRSLGIKSQRFNPCWPVGRACNSMIATSEELIRAKTCLFSMMVKERNPRIDNELFFLARRFYSLKKGRKINPGICSSRPCGGGRNVVAITPEGRILTCGRADGLNNDIGVLVNVNEIPTPEMWRMRLNKFYEPQRKSEECKSCFARDICTGGCPSFLWQSPEMRNVICAYTKGIAQLFNKNLSRIAELDRISRRNGSRIGERKQARPNKAGYKR